MAERICYGGRCYLVNPNAPTPSVTTKPTTTTSNYMNNAIIRGGGGGCVTIASLDKNIADAKRRGAKYSIDFHTKRKADFLAGKFDEKLKMQGCPLLGASTRPRPTTTSTSVCTPQQIASGTCGARQASSPSPSRCTPQQIRTGTCGARTTTTTTSRGGCSPQQVRTGTCGARSSSSSTTKAGIGSGISPTMVILVLAVGGGLFWAFKSGKLDPIIAKIKGAKRKA